MILLTSQGQKVKRANSETQPVKGRENCNFTNLTNFSLLKEKKTFIFLLYGRGIEGIVHSYLRVFTSFPKLIQYFLKVFFGSNRQISERFCEIFFFS